MWRQVEKVLNSGNATFDLGSGGLGHLEIVGGMLFSACKGSGAPLAEFKDVAASDKALQDVAQFLLTFTNVEFCIEGHVKAGKGSLDYWTRMASNRAELVKDNLVKFGAKAGLISTQGLAGPESLNRSCIRLVLHLFSCGAGKGNRSPRK